MNISRVHGRRKRGVVAHGLFRNGEGGTPCPMNGKRAGRDDSATYRIKPSGNEGRNIFKKLGPDTDFAGGVVLGH